MKNYIRLRIAYNEITYDAIYNRLYMEDITSILEENGVIETFLPETEFPHAETIKDSLINFDGVNPSDISIDKFENADWNKEWEATIEPVYICNKIIIYPSWKKNELKNPEGKILIEIDPKMSFGTGHNETTQLILEMMCEHFAPSDKFMLDYGCGTGILAIAGIKLGAEKTVAIDIDEDSIANAEEYIAENSAAGRITLHKADVSDIQESGFDIIAANISSSVIIPNLVNINNKLVRGGKLFLTGILNDEAEELVNALTAHNFMLKELRSKAEWSGFYCIKK